MYLPYNMLKIHGKVTETTRFPSYIAHQARCPKRSWPYTRVIAMLIWRMVSGSHFVSSNRVVFPSIPYLLGYETW